MIGKKFWRSVLITWVLVFVPLYADENKQYLSPYLDKISPDILAILPTPPIDGSAEQKAEIALIKSVSGKRSKAEAALAESQILLDFFTFSPVIGTWFKKESFPKTSALFQKVEITTKGITNVGKNFWKRKRPYDSDPSINVLKKEKSLSYPSGHSTRGMVYASVLAEIFPDKKEALLEFGRNVGWNRIVAGVHYPTDVFAGRILGMAIARELLKNPMFLKDLEEVRQEIQAVLAK